MQSLNRLGPDELRVLCWALQEYETTLRCRAQPVRDRFCSGQPVLQSTIYLADRDLRDADTAARLLQMVVVRVAAELTGH